ncbi:MAG TPA: TRCF domain-containing protein, partial [Dehalococcoidia bacterium]|nr:TRCF domain-containing protein [Dehalococcoidia bacterium]
EIRGAGNLLGAEQSGQIGAVGFDLYTRLLADAVEGLKALARGEEPPPSKMQPPITIDVPLTAFIPESYIGDINLRLALYQRMAAAEGAGAAADLERELTDRFGPPPAPVRNLLYVVHLRALAKRAGVIAIAREEAPSGQPVLTVRAVQGEDFRARVAPSRRRDLERDGIATIGHNQMRINLDAAGDGWRELLARMLEAAAREPEAVAV